MTPLMPVADLEARVPPRVLPLAEHGEGLDIPRIEFALKDVSTREKN